MFHHSKLSVGTSEARIPAKLRFTKTPIFIQVVKIIIIIIVEWAVTIAVLDC